MSKTAAIKAAAKTRTEKSTMAKTGANKLSHYNADGRATMVDVSAKTPTRREAEASAFVEMSAEVLHALPGNPKGNPWK